MSDVLNRLKKANNHTPAPSAAPTINGSVATNRLFCIGGNSRGGTYILRIRVSKSLNMAFGRFKGGKNISVPAGEHCYIGSALSEQGATCLARRLVRHASRLGDHRPHPIRLDMFTEFPQRGLEDGDLQPRNPKKPRWNVDYLLDKPSVELIAAYLIRSPQRIEAEVGKWLENDPATVAFEPGLGANDLPGNTHLMQVVAEESWWEELPARLAARFPDPRDAVGQQG